MAIAVSESVEAGDVGKVSEKKGEGGTFEREHRYLLVAR